MMARLMLWWHRWLHTAEAKRVDRERMYVWIHLGIISIGLSVVLLPAAVNIGIGAGVNTTLGALILLGSGLCLVSSAMGTSKFMPETKIDVRVPYLSGAFGQLSVVAAISYFLVHIAAHLPWIINLQVGYSYAIALGCLHISAVALKEAWRIGHFVKHPDCKWWPASGR